MVYGNLKILPPWSTFINKIKALFESDPQITFEADYNGDNPSVALYTNNPEKATALLKLLPDEKEFGEVKLHITVDCYTFSNRVFTTPKELFETAFSGNPALSYVVTSEGWFAPFTYIVFKNCVVQFFNDNLNDPHGVLSTLYQDIAPEVFASCELCKEVSYCTDVNI